MLYRTFAGLSAVTLGAALSLSVAQPAGEHEGGHMGGQTGGHAEADEHGMMQHMKEQHADHEHGHDFAAMEQMSDAEVEAVMDTMIDVGLAMPPMDSDRGRDLFAEKGCVVCHRVNGIGGEIGPPLDAAEMPEPMNAFEFAARMWRSAPAMAEMQEDLFGAPVELSGQELADLIAFAHDEAEQRELALDQVPERFRELLPED